MSNNELALTVRGLSKAYSIARNSTRHTTLGEAFVHRLSNPISRVQRDTFWALRDIDLDINKGDVVGIIARNGAGKSTLLKVLSRITEPTTGVINLYGRVGSLLEVGTGFHPELTGRENVFLNGSILGMRRAEVNTHFDAIVQFAGVEQFIDTPVKRYSTGMYVRLAFAVAAHLNPDILMIDEVLSVGDSEFQKKCLGKMKDVASTGRTVLFVSHNMQAVSQLCNRGLYLKSGHLEFQGDVDSAIEKYIDSFSSDDENRQSEGRRAGSGRYKFAWARAAKGVYRGDETKEFSFRIEHKREKVGRMYLLLTIVNSFGAVLVQCDSRYVDGWFRDAPTIEGTVKIFSPWLKPGEYRVDFSLLAQGEVLDVFEGACFLNISELLPYDHSAGMRPAEAGLVFAEFACDLTTGGDQPPSLVPGE